MKNFIKHLLVVLIVLLTQKAIAQSFPVSINTVIYSPYSPYLEDYIEPGSQKLQINIQLNDPTLPEYRCKLRLTIEGVGITIRTRQNFTPQPTILQGGGVPNILYGEDLAAYFNPANLDFAGISKASYTKGAKLPEGIYRFSFEVLDYNRGTTVSNKGTATAWIILNNPPLLTVPRKDVKVSIVDPTNIVFSWTPRHTGSPNAAFNAEYIFKLVEIWPTNRNPYDAFLSQQPLYETTTTFTQIAYGPAEPALIAGRKYAWQVQAKDIDGKDLFKNEGKSEVYVFQFGDLLGIPERLALQKANPSSLIVRWEQPVAGTDAVTYTVRYRPHGKRNHDNWYIEKTSDQWKTIPLLQPNTEYEVQVRAEQGAQVSNYGAVKIFKTAIAGANDFVCKSDVSPPKVPANTIPATKLAINDTIYAADYKVLVRELIANKGGTYTGSGVMIVPWFNLAKVRVDFKNIHINEKHQLTAGEIITTRSSDNKFVLNVTKPAAASSDSTADSTLTVAIPVTYTISGTIDSIYVKDDGKITVIDTEGNESTFEQKKDERTGKAKETVIADAAGNSYTVGADGKVTKKEGSAGGNGAATVQPDPIKDRIIVLILEQFEEEIAAWLRSNGKGGEDDPDVLLAEELPQCFEREAKFLQLVNDHTIPYYKEHPGELVAKIESRQSGKTLLARIAGLFKNKENVQVQNISTEDQTGLQNEMCEPMNEHALLLVDRLIACLAGATIDVGLQYTFKWVELWMDDKPVSFTNYKAVFGALDASQVAVSASIACAAAMIPIIPSSKNKLIVAVVAGLGDGAYAMANNIYKQYDELEAKYPNASVGELIGKINWQDAVMEGGVNFVITGITTGVVLYAKGNPKFVNFARQLEDKIKRQGTVFLEKAGLSKESIDVLLNKLGIRNIRTFLLQLPTTPVSIRNGNINVTDHWSKFATSFDLDDNIAQAIRKSTGSSIVDLAEEGVIKQFTSNGFVPFITKYGGNNGLDALLANSNDLASATRVILLEIKSSTANSVPFGVKLGEGYNGYQLDDQWLDGVITKMSGNGQLDKTIERVGQALRRIYDNNLPIIEKYVVEVDANATAKVLRIE